jgi:hypothetical protein
VDRCTVTNISVETLCRRTHAPKYVNWATKKRLSFHASFWYRHPAIRSAGKLTDGWNRRSQYIVLPKQYQPPQMLQYTASMQHEFGRGWQFQLDYIGNRTLFNSYAFPMSPAVYIPGTCGGSPCSTLGNTASRFSLTMANPTRGPYFSGGGDKGLRSFLPVQMRVTTA